MSSYTKAVLLEKLSSQQLTENENVEFKSQWHQDYGKSISAIGNEEEGGWLIVGIDDKGFLLGKNSDRIKKQEANIENHISQYLEPNSTVQSISVEIVNKKKFILIEIINPKAVVSWNGKFYKRVGSSVITKRFCRYNYQAIMSVSVRYKKSFNFSLTSCF